MIEKRKIANIMDLLIEDCDECPLDKICKEGNCSDAWENFLNSKVKAGGVEECGN